MTLRIHPKIITGAGCFAWLVAIILTISAVGESDNPIHQKLLAFWLFILIIVTPTISIIYLRGRRLGTHNLTKYVSFSFAVLIFAILMELLESWQESMFWDASSFQLIAMPIVMVGWLSYKKIVPISKLLMQLGIPLGLIGVTIGINGMSIFFITEAPTPESLTISELQNAVNIIAAVYGAFFSLIGYFLARDLETTSAGLISYKEATFITLLVMSWWLYPIVSGAGIAEFLDTKAAIFTIAICMCSVGISWGNRRRFCASLTDAAIYSAVISLIVALVLWYNAGTNPNIIPIRFACLSLMYSLMIYVCAFIFSFSTGEYNNINFSIKNWHWVETTTFFIFLVFAPISISDYLYNEMENQQNNTVENELKLEIAHLNERLAALEKVSRAD